MKKNLNKVLFVFVVLALAIALLPQAQASAVTFPQAQVTSVVQNGESVVIGGNVPNYPLPWGWTAFYQPPVINISAKTIKITVLRSGSDCPNCGISNPPFVPYSLSVPLAGRVGYKVYVNGTYRLTLQAPLFSVAKKK